MYYFKQNGEKIEKYQINFNKEEIEKLKLEIINNCSFIKHVEYTSDYSPKFKDISLKKKFKSKYVGKKEYFEEAREIYSYSYDEYNPPYLVELINRLLNGDITSIDNILNYYIISNELSIDDKIKIVNQELIGIAPENINAKKEKLQELENLLETKKLNQHRQSIVPFYKQLISLINFDLVDSLSISEIKKVEDFLGISSLEFDKIFDNSKVNETAKILKK